MVIGTYNTVMITISASGDVTFANLANAAIGYVKSSTAGLLSRQTGVPVSDLTTSITANTIMKSNGTTFVASALVENGSLKIGNLTYNAIAFVIPANTLSEIEMTTITVGASSEFNLKVTIGYYGNNGSGNGNWEGMISGYSSDNSLCTYTNIINASDSSNVTMSMSVKSNGVISVKAKNTNATYTKICRGHYVVNSIAD
jgi:hypothetical protein